MTIICTASQAIVVRLLGSTSPVSLMAEYGDGWTIVEYDDELDHTHNFITACFALCEKLRLDKDYIGGFISADKCVFVETSRGSVS